MPAVPDLAVAIATSFDKLDVATEGHTDGRTVPNFLGSDGDLDRAWSASTRARLALVKFAVDPHHTIRSNRPVQG